MSAGLSKHSCFVWWAVLTPPPPLHGELSSVTRVRSCVLIPIRNPPSCLPRLFRLTRQLYTLVQHVEVASIKGLQTENADQA